MKIFNDFDQEMDPKFGTDVKEEYIEDFINKLADKYNVDYEELVCKIEEHTAKNFYKKLWSGLFDK